MEQYEEVATGKREKTGLGVPTIHNDFFSPVQSKSQRRYIGFLRARTVAMNMQQHGVRTDFLHFQRVVTGLHHEGNSAKVEKAYQTWLRGLDANSRSQADYYAAIIRGEDPASQE